MPANVTVYFHAMSRSALVPTIGKVIVDRWILKELYVWSSKQTSSEYISQGVQQFQAVSFKVTAKYEVVWFV